MTGHSTVYALPEGLPDLPAGFEPADPPTCQPDEWWTALYGPTGSGDPLATTPEQPS